MVDEPQQQQRPGSRGSLAHLDHLDHPGDEAPADELPPGPWKWQRTEDHGESLLADDGTVVLSSEGGHGWQEIHPAAKELLAQAWLLGLKADEEALRGDRVEAAVAVGLLNEVKALREQLREARGWAWSLEHRVLDYRAMGVDPDEGRPMEPAWLTAEIAPYETVHELDGDGFIWGTFTAGDHVWVTDGTEPMYARVTNALDDRAAVKVLTSVTDAVAPQEPTS